MAANSAEWESISYRGIIFSAAGVTENDGRSRTATVPRGSIENIRLVYGFRARYPLLMAVLGIFLTLLGLASAFYLVCWLANGGGLWTKPMYGVPWLLFGPPVLYESMQRGYILEVKTTAELRRLEFHQSANSWELETFLDTVERAYGYSVERGPL